MEYGKHHTSEWNVHLRWTWKRTTRPAWRQSKQSTSQALWSIFLQGSNSWKSSIRFNLQAPEHLRYVSLPYGAPNRAGSTCVSLPCLSHKVVRVNRSLVCTADQRHTYWTALPFRLNTARAPKALKLKATKDSRVKAKHGSLWWSWGWKTCVHTLGTRERMSFPVLVVW